MLITQNGLEFQLLYTQAREELYLPTSLGTSAVRDGSPFIDPWPSGLMTMSINSLMNLSMVFYLGKCCSHSYRFHQSVYLYLTRSYSLGRYKPCSPAVLQKKFSRALKEVRSELSQGAHSSAAGEAGEELDTAQKHVEELDRCTQATGATATRVRRQNRVVERSLIGQQPAFGSHGQEIRDQLARPGRNPRTNNNNPFISTAEQTAASPSQQTAVSPSRTSTRQGPSNAVSPDGPTNATATARRTAPRRERRSYASNSSGRSAAEAIEFADDAVAEASRNIAQNISRSMQSARRANTAAAVGTTNPVIQNQFLHESSIASLSSYLGPMVEVIQNTVDNRTIESIRTMHNMLTSQYERNIERAGTMQRGSSLSRSLNEYENQARTRFQLISEGLQTSAVQRHRTSGTRESVGGTNRSNTTARTNDDIGQDDDGSDSSISMVSIGLDLERARRERNHRRSGGDSNN